MLTADCSLQLNRVRKPNCAGTDAFVRSAGEARACPHYLRSWRTLGNQTVMYSVVALGAGIQAAVLTHPFEVKLHSFPDGFLCLVQRGSSCAQAWKIRGIGRPNRRSTSRG